MKCDSLIDITSSSPQSPSHRCKLVAPVYMMASAYEEPSYPLIAFHLTFTGMPQPPSPCLWAGCPSSNDGVLSNDFHPAIFHWGWHGSLSPLFKCAYYSTGPWVQHPLSIWRYCGCPWVMITIWYFKGYPSAQTHPHLLVRWFLSCPTPLHLKMGSILCIPA